MPKHTPHVYVLKGSLASRGVSLEAAEAAAMFAKDELALAISAQNYQMA